MASRILRSLGRKLSVMLTVIFSLLYLIPCGNAWLHPDEWWWAAVLGLVFPLLAIFVIFFLIFWIVLRSRWFILPLLALLLSVPNMSVLMAFHLSAHFNQEKTPGNIRLLTWNVKWFDEQKKEDGRSASGRKEMLAFIGRQQADVICFQEFLASNYSEEEKFNNVQAITRLGYPYHYVAGDYLLRKGVFKVGVAIFSRYPIEDTFRLQYPGPISARAAESLIAADININGRLLRVFTTHLQSLRFQKQDYRDIQIIRNAEDSIIDASKSILRKMKQAYSYRGYQADLVREQLDHSPYPSVICGDFNDVPNSYTYFRIRGNRSDAFLQKGFGIGRTFANLSPTLRIDYILPDRRFKVNQFRLEKLPYSDHYPIMADLEWVKAD